MAIITQRGTVDLIPEYNRALRPIFCVSEGDANSRVINLSVTSGGEAFTIPSGAMVYVAGKKQDNNIFTYGCSFTSNTVVFPITAQMSALDGIVLCELQIIQNGNPLGTANFVYWVEPSPIQNGTTSESDLNLFEEAISKFENFDHFYADVEAMVTEAVANMQIREGQTVIDASLSVAGAAADAKATGDIVRAFMDALVTESTAEAAIATCDDAAGGLPLKKLTANIVPAQAGSGDPSPDNVRAISGYTGVTVTRTGKNLLNYDAWKSVTLTRGTAIFENNGVSLTATANDAYTNQTIGAYPANARIAVETGKTYVFTWDCDADAQGRVYVFSIRDGQAVSLVNTLATNKTLSFTAGANDKFITFRLGVFYAGATIHYRDLMFRQATDDSTFEQSQVAIYPVTFPTAAGTVYGGTLIVNSDGSGALTVDTAGWTFDGTETPSNIGTLTNYYRARYNTANLAGTSIVDGVTKYSHGIIDNTYAGDFAHAYGTPSYVYAFVPIVEGLSVKQYMAAQAAANTPVQVTYKLATPTTYALSAVQVATMLNGVNNVWTDTAGTLTTEYYASTGLYVEKRVNAQRNMIAGVEEAMIATKNYSVNDLLIVGNTLYKVTAAISSGAALVVGTNVTETTVAEQLLALA